MISDLDYINFFEINRKSLFYSANEKYPVKDIPLQTEEKKSKEDLVEARFRFSCNEPPRDGIVKSLKSLANERYEKNKMKVKELNQTSLNFAEIL